MGKHKNPMTLQFLGLLKENGRIYNFSVEEEYPLINGVFDADLVYKLPSYNQPIISFEVESSPVPYAVKNAVKYFSTKSADVPKPWQHFIIILNGKLKSSDKISIQCVTEKHPVHIFENIFGDSKELDRFNKKLEEMSKAFKIVQETRNKSNQFRIDFSAKVKQCISSIERQESEIDDAIDDLIMAVKEVIEKWDVPSTRFATVEIFEGFYKLSAQRSCEPYVILEDLCKYAYSQRKRLLDSMIQPFYSILLEAWIEGYDIEKGEQACQFLLRLGTAFLQIDISISQACIEAIDNLAGDMFEAEILSKEILFCAIAYEKSKDNPRLKEFVETYSDWIRVNEEYSWDDDRKGYLSDSIKLAEKEQDSYDIKIRLYKNNVLLPIFNRIIDSEIKDYVEFLEETIEETDNYDTTWAGQDLSKMIHAYTKHRPNFAIEIKNTIMATNKKPITELFNAIINNNSFLMKTYKDSKNNYA